MAERDSGSAERAAAKQIGAMVLPNGMPVEFYYDLPPRVADVAICTTDNIGNAGRANHAVSESLDLPLDALQHDGTESAWLVDAPEGKRALVVRTVGQGRIWSLAARALRAGVEPLVTPDGVETLWLAALGVRSGGLTFEDGLRVCLHTLGSLGGVGRFRVLFSLLGGNEEIPPDLELFSWTADTATLSLRSEQLERHVAQAFAQASALAGSGPITARHVVEAICGSALADQSPAYRTVSSLFAPPTRPVQPLADESEAFGRLAELTVSPQLAHAFLGIPDYVRESSRTIWGRDLVALLLLSRDPSLDDLAKESGTSVASLRDHWLAYVLGDQTTHRRREDWLSWWRDFGFQTDGLIRRSGYLPELLEVDDQLDVTREIEAVAGLICDESVGPPLSIALLGDWGSGKSFFIRKVKKRVEASKGQPGYCENPVTIELNAWHMSDANLWASLVDQIFQELRKAIFGERTPDAAFSEELEEAQGALSAAKQQLRDATAAWSTARNELAQAEEEVRRLDASQRVRAAAESLGLGEVYQSILDVERSAGELSQAAGESRKLLRAVLRPRSLRRGLVGVVISILAGLALALVSTIPALAGTLDETLRTLGSFAAVAGSIVGGLSGALTKGASLLNQFNKEIHEAKQEYDKGLKLPKSVEAQTLAKYETALSNVRAAKEHLRRVESTGVIRDPLRDLHRFIDERARSEDYRSRQGVMSLVRRDFDKLAKMMHGIRDAKKAGPLRPRAEKSDSKTEDQSWKTNAKAVDRVILCIDDLDRCRPHRVVEVLEAVHLLLGFDLFVVIVAVDSRWMLRALEVHYKDLLTTAVELEDDGPGEAFRDSTPQNYLEKIFQIPFALAPMSEHGFRQYVGFLVNEAGERVTDLELANQATAEDSSKSDAQPAGRQQKKEQPGEPEEGAGAPGAAARPPKPTPPGSTWGKERQSEDQPRIIVITRPEREVMARLRPLLPTPRQAKRLVNVFRLVKLQILDDDMNEFERERGGHRAALVLLAILFGRPRLAHVLFREIFELNSDSPPRLLRDYMKAWQEGLESSTRNGDRLLAREVRDVLGAINAHDEDLTLADSAVWIETVARYSLVTGQDWHTWIRGTFLKQQRNARLVSRARP